MYNSLMSIARNSRLFSSSSKFVTNRVLASLGLHVEEKSMIPKTEAVKLATKALGDYHPDHYSSSSSSSTTVAGNAEFNDLARYLIDCRKEASRGSDIVCVTRPGPDLEAKINAFASSYKVGGANLSAADYLIQGHYDKHGKGLVPFFFSSSSSSSQLQKCQGKEGKGGGGIEPHAIRCGDAVAVVFPASFTSSSATAVTAATAATTTTTTHSPIPKLGFGLDVSGSMGHVALSRETSFSLFNLASHAFKLFLASSSAKGGSSPALCAFSDRIVSYDAASVEKIVPDSGTDFNLFFRWASATFPQLAHVIFFTDGHHNSGPFRFNANAKTTFHTVGFGRDDNINSDLLSQIAVNTGGLFAYIPDGNMMATTMQNLIASVSSICHSKIVVRCENAGTAGNNNNNNNNNNSSSQERIFFTNQGEEKIVVLDKIPSSVTSVEYCVHDGSDGNSQSSWVRVPIREAATQEEQDKVMVRKLTEQLAWSLLSYKNNGRQGQQSFTKAHIEMLKAPERVRAELKPLLHSVESEKDGQICLALLHGYYESWGRHYLNSLATYLLAGKNMTGFDSYAKENVELMKHIQTLTVQTAVRDMSGVCHSGDAVSTDSRGCIDGETSVFRLAKSGLAWEKTKLVLIRKGDVLKTVDPHTGVDTMAWVEYVTHNHVREPMFMVGPFTPHHPVLVSGINGTDWHFPIKLWPARGTKRHVDTLVHVVFAQRGAALCTADEGEFSKVAAAGLAHGLESSRVIYHPFMGTEKIIKTLNKFGVSHDGVVDLTGRKFSRKDGFVCDIV
jgi:hypothetical protein